MDVMTFTIHGVKRIDICLIYFELMAWFEDKILRLAPYLDHVRKHAIKV